MALNFSNPDSFMLWYQQQLQRLVPTVKAPKVGDWQKVVEGTRPVLEQEERAARQRAASQFAKLGMPVSSAYMERLGRIGGETAAKMADITNKYAFEAAQKQADLEMQAALANQQAMMQATGGLGGLLQQLFGGAGGQQGPATTYQVVDRENPEVKAAREKCGAITQTPSELQRCMAQLLGVRPETVSTATSASGWVNASSEAMNTRKQAGYQPATASGCVNASSEAMNTCKEAGYQPATAAYRTCYEKWLQYYLEQNRAKGC